MSDASHVAPYGWAKGVTDEVDECLTAGMCGLLMVGL